jgi:hypothetical protein
MERERERGRERLKEKEREKEKRGMSESREWKMIGKGEMEPTTKRVRKENRKYI